MSYLNTKYKTFIIVIIVIILNSCNSDDFILINLNIETSGDKQINLECLSPDKFYTIETKTVSSKRKNCVFKLKKEEVKNCFYCLKIDNRFILLYPLNSNLIEINTETADISKNYTINADKDNLLIKELNSKMLEFADSVQILEHNFRQAQINLKNDLEEDRQIVNKKAKIIFTQAENYLQNFIYAHKQSPVIYLALVQYIDIYPVFTLEKKSELFDFVYENLETYNPNLADLTVLKSKIDKYKLELELKQQNEILKLGDCVPDFSFKDSNGKIISRRQFEGKNYIIFFWASWNKESLDAIPNVLNLLKEKNKDILFVSLDNNFRSWNYTIIDMNIKELNNVCDFKSWDSPFVKIFGLKQIPAYFVVDENNIIVEIKDKGGF